MVLGKIKDMVGGDKKEGSGNRNIKRVSSIDEDTEYNRSPISNRNKRRDLDLPSEESVGRIGTRQNTNNPGRPRSEPSRKIGRQRPAENRNNYNRDRKPDREPRTQRARRWPPRDRREDDTMEMLQEILRRLEDIDRKISRQPRR